MTKSWETLKALAADPDGLAETILREASMEEVQQLINQLTPLLVTLMDSDAAAAAAAEPPASALQCEVCQSNMMLSGPEVAFAHKSCVGPPPPGLEDVAARARVEVVAESTLAYLQLVLAHGTRQMILVFRNLAQAQQLGREIAEGTRLVERHNRGRDN